MHLRGMEMRAYDGDRLGRHAALSRVAEAEAETGSDCAGL